MTNILLVSLLAVAVVSLLVQLRLMFRPAQIDLAAINEVLQSVERSYDSAERVVREEIAKSREESAVAARESRQELAGSLKGTGDSLNQQILNLIASNTQNSERVRETLEQRLKTIQTDDAAGAKQLREEVGTALKSFNDSVLKGMTGMSDIQHKQLAGFSEQLGKLIESNQQKLDLLKASVEEQLRAIREENARQLDQMRATVDEKLQGTLEKRLGESFKLVSQQLEQVHKGLGEMQALATGVGDLKRVLTNVKTRGTWGEVQLGALLEQVLSPEQYATNVATRDAGERVEFAIKLPGRTGDKEETIWLPIDAKFPIEDYQRLVEAQDQADPDAVEEAGKHLELRIKQCARDICDKYIGPPKTTDFGILFLPTEGLFAEVVRRTGLPEYVQRGCRVVIAGPTTLWSILNSLQMGFRTLAIEKRSSEVWKVLGAVKTEFGKFGELLDGVKKKLDQASDNIETAARKSRTIERRLRDVQELPAADAQSLLLIDNSRATDGDFDAET